MKLPPWYREARAAQGARLVAGTTTEAKAVTALVPRVTTDREFTRLVVADYVLRSVRTWVGKHGGPAVEDDGQTVLFIDIPRRLEVSPGRFADQAVMTRADWRAAVKQAETKADNATGHADRVRAAAEKILPLLVDDDLTTADVWVAA